MQTWSPWLMVMVLLATERPPCMRSTAMSSGASGVAARAKTVWIVFTTFPSCPAQPGHHGLREELPAEDHVVLGGQIGGAVSVVADGLEPKRVEERVHREHRVSLSIVPSRLRVTSRP